MLAPEPRLLGYAASLASLGSGFIAVGAPRHDGKTGVVDIAHSSRLRTSAGRLFGENPGCLFGSAVAALVQWPRRAVVAVGEPCPEEPTGKVFIVELELRAGGTVVAEKNRVVLQPVAAGGGFGCSLAALGEDRLAVGLCAGQQVLIFRLNASHAATSATPPLQPVSRPYSFGASLAFVRLGGGVQALAVGGRRLSFGEGTVWLFALNSSDAVVSTAAVDMNSEPPAPPPRPCSAVHTPPPPSITPAHRLRPRTSEGRDRASEPARSPSRGLLLGVEAARLMPPQSSGRSPHFGSSLAAMLDANYDG